MRRSHGFFSRGGGARRPVGLVGTGPERRGGGDGREGEHLPGPVGVVQVRVLYVEAPGFQAGKARFDAPAQTIEFQGVVVSFQAV